MEGLANFIEQLVTSWTGSLEQSGYLGIFILMTVESSFIPFPSEIVMLPVGSLAAQGRINLWGAVLAGTAGSLAGALFNYCFALWLGRGFLLRYGRFFFLPAEKIAWAQEKWERHGELTTFVCRLLPAIRQLISIPAGLARMNVARFCFWTSFGAGLWVTVLTVTGYWLGEAAERLWMQSKSEITLGLLLGGTLIVGGYIAMCRLRTRRLKPVEACDLQTTGSL